MVAEEQPLFTTSPLPKRTTTSSKIPLPVYQLHAGVVLSRPPQITRDLHPFEKAFFLYQRRLNERLALPFTRYFYFKKGTPADVEWKRKAKERLTPARDIGVYNAYGREGWNDELLVGALESEPEHQMEALLKDAEAPGVGTTAAAEAIEAANNADTTAAEAAAAKKPEVERPASRVSEADEKKDLSSLDRLLQRTVYLVVKNKDGRWTFPSSQLVGKEHLHTVSVSITLSRAKFLT